ncbi:hypothetical protein BVX94_01990 [bacterium B17]|nr:hypothetical protein BVX94_01990 [bacterium B17]
MKKTYGNISRRSFLNKSAAVSFGFSVMPAYLAIGKKNSAGELPPSERLNIGCVGCGGRAGGDIDSLIKKGAEPVSFCDVDPNRGGIAKWKAKYPKASVHKDFRVMFEKNEKDMDAVCIAAPDHVHFAATMDAMQRGKHVYVEKPLTHTFNEAEMLIKAEKKFKVVTQMGNQGHTGVAAAQFKKMVDNGVISDIIRIDAWKRQSLWFMNGNERIKDYPAEEPVPEGLDWDIWCGPAEKKPFSSKYHPFNWRGFYLYGTGMFGDWGAHLIDMAHEYLDLGLPEKITPVKINDHNKVIFPEACHIHMKFPARGKMPAVDLHWRDGKGYWDAWHYINSHEQYLAKNEKGELQKPRLGHAGTFLHRKQADYGILRGSHAAGSRLLPYAKMKDFGAKLKGESPGDHYGMFVSACKGEGKTWSPFSVAGPLTQTLLIGAACQYLNAELEFDRKKKRFTNNEEANALLDGAKPRKGYEDYYKVV